MINLMHGDCLQRMKEIPDNSVDMVLTDPPYGTTACKWDSVIPFDEMWRELKRIVKNEKSAIALFGSEPFSSSLRGSNIKEFRHDWIWDKKFSGNFTLAKYAPMKTHEIISIFASASANYYPQKTERDKPIKSGGNKCSSESAKVAASSVVQGFKRTYFDKYPESIIRLSNRLEKRGLHPTQKPVALLEYLIKTYTLEGETVLDFTMGSGSTGVACKNLNRKFIGIEKDDKYFEIAKKRIEDA